MSLSIKRNAEAPELDGVSPGTSYPVFSLTDHNAVILSDDKKLLTVGYKQINDTDHWSVVEENLKNKELPQKPEDDKKATAPETKAETTTCSLAG